MLYFSSLLKTKLQYSTSAQNLFAALDANKIKYDLLPGTRDIWMRDFMPVQRKDGTYISFRYDPSYLKDQPQLQTDFRRDISGRFSIFDGPDDVIYSNINLDGGNVVLSPSKGKAVISDRVFSENPGYAEGALIRVLEELLTTHIIVIPSLPSDMTGHADGMVRFVDGNTVIGNDTPYKNGLEQRVKAVLEREGLRVLDFPYYDAPGESAAGCYLNFLKTERYIFLPIFGHKKDQEAIQAAERIFSKEIVPLRIDEIAARGGGLNCVSWEVSCPDG